MLNLLLLITNVSLLLPLPLNDKTWWHELFHFTSIFKEGGMNWMITFLFNNKFKQAI